MTSWSGAGLSLASVFFRRQSAHSVFNSQGQPRETCVDRGRGGRVLGDSLYSLGPMSNTVNFICHLITSMGYCSLLPTVPLLWAQNVAQGQQAQATPGAGRRSTLTFLPPPSAACLPPPWPTHPASFPPKHHLPGALKDCLAPGTAGCSRSSHTPQLLGPSSSRPACPLLGVGANRSTLF